MASVLYISVESESELDDTCVVLVLYISVNK